MNLIEQLGGYDFVKVAMFCTVRMKTSYNLLK